MRAVRHDWVTATPMVNALLVAAAVLAVRATAQVQTTRPVTVRDTTFVYFGGDTVRVELAELEVPERYDLASSDSILVRALVFPSASPSPGQPVVFLAGGPGSSAFRVARGMQEVIETLRRRGPFIALAQRGTWGADPYLACPETARYPDDRPLTRDALEAMLRDAARACASHWVEHDVDLRGYHTRAIARDVEELRRALDYEGVDLWAWSYGTQVAVDVIRVFPGSVRRAVLTSLHRPDAAVASPAEAERALTTLDSLWSGHPVFGRTGSSVRSILRRTLAELEEAPARVTLEDPVAGTTRDVVVGPFDLRYVVSRALQYRGSVESGLPALLMDLLDGDMTSLADWTLTAGARSWSGNAMALAVGCATGLPLEFRQRARAQAGSALLGMVPTLSELLVCDVVPHADLGAEFRRWFHSDVPILYIDPGLGTERSPLADSLARWMPNSRRLHVHWGFHAELEPWARFAPAITAFLDGHPLPYDTIALPPPMPPTPRERLEALVSAVGEMENRGLLTAVVADEVRSILQPIVSRVEDDPAAAIRLLRRGAQRIVFLARDGLIGGGLARGALLGPIENVVRALRLGAAAFADPQSFGRAGAE